MAPLVKVLSEAPPSLVGAPHPTILADEHRVVLLYYTANDYDKAVCVFDHCFEYRMGMPGEDAVQKYSLHEYGVTSFEAFVIENSPWISELESRYSVISDFSVGDRIYKHYMFSSHDRSFECVASGLTVTTICDQRQMSEVISELPKFLDRK